MAATKPTDKIREITDLRDRVSFNTVEFPEGLDRFSIGLANVGFGSGGCDILWEGDSKKEGSGAPDYFSRLPHQVKLALQEEFNPVGPDGFKVGGFNWMPVRNGTNGRNGKAGAEGGGMTYDGDLEGDLSWEYYGTAETYNGSGIGPGTRSQSVPAGDSNYYVLTVKGSALRARYKRSRITSFEVVARRATDAGVMRIDVNEVGSGIPAVGAGIVLSTSFSTNGSSSYGRHWGNGGGPGTGVLNTTAGTDLDPAKDYYIRITAPSAGDGRKIYFDGLVLYCWDENAGVRLHNLAHAGTKTDSFFLTTGGTYLVYPLTLDTGQLQANIDAWTRTADSDTTTIGASRAKAIGWNWITNNQGGGEPPATSLEDFTTMYGMMVEYALTTSSLPSVYLHVPPIAAGAGAANRFTQSQTWVPEIRDIAATHDHVIFINSWAAMGSTTRALSIEPVEMDADALHENRRGQKWLENRQFTPALKGERF